MRQPLAIRGRNVPLALDERIELLELSYPDCRENVGQPVIESDIPVHILDRAVLGLCAQVTGTLRPVGSIGRDHAAAAGRHELVAVETETGDAGAAPHRFAPVERA